MNDKYITVTSLNKYIKFKLDNDENLNEVFLRGEISNFKAHTRGHYYFTIKDENSRINAIMFASSVKTLSFMPLDGMKVLLVGRVSVYENSGTYQVYVNEMLEDGIGNLYIAYEQLKKKLMLEGLFDESRKKTIPKIPQKIGIVTAPTGAAIKDIISTIKRRWPISQTIIFPALVQGEGSKESIVEAIKKANELGTVDLLIVGRGGGSIEDLWAFNEEVVARAIYNSNIPIISAVGHEVDFTIADLVADLRAPTPTGAAEMAVPDINNIKEYLYQIKTRLIKVIMNNININKEILSRLTNSYILKNPINIYQVKEQTFANILDKLYNNVLKIIELKKYQYNNINSKLEVLNPQLTLKRGYSITKLNNKIITSINEIKQDDLLNIKVFDGNIKAKVMEE
ncbi:MAG: exodeoxyribonuclease VII large subunit [Tenericutes bacterium]|jgi:exodeoxyribonuclease VII large subunit|nr:exodeoxyribonuclease VII large subunit [Mycoplasmatota bacterium]